MDRDPKPAGNNIISLEEHRPRAETYKQKKTSEEIEKKLLYGSLQDTLQLLKSGVIKAEDLERKTTLSKTELHLLREFACILGRYQLQKFDLEKRTLRYAQLLLDFEKQKNRIDKLKKENKRLKTAANIFHPEKEK